MDTFWDILPIHPHARPFFEMILQGSLVENFGGWADHDVANTFEMILWGSLIDHFGARKFQNET